MQAYTCEFDTVKITNTELLRKIMDSTSKLHVKSLFGLDAERQHIQILTLYTEEGIDYI
jgi:hypothetical protein